MLLKQLGKLVAWDIELAALPGSGKLNKENHPLAPSMDRVENRKKQVPLGTFVNKLNRIFRKGRR
jgi:hypothetical protein